MKLSVDEIRRILPHRYPMLLVDRVNELEPLVSGKGVKAVSYNEPYFQGHFPSKSVMPGVMVIEALTQLIHIVIASAEEYKSKYVYYGGISRAKFYGTVTPGCLLELEVSRKGGISSIAEGGGMMIFSVKASAEGVEVFTGDITVLVVEPDLQ